MTFEIKFFCLLSLLAVFLRSFLEARLQHISKWAYLHSRSDGRLFNHACLQAKAKVRQSTIRDLFFADDAAEATHTKEELQSLMDHFSRACKNFGLTINLKKTTSSVKILSHRQASQLVLMSWKLSTSSHTLSPRSLTTSHLTRRLTRGLGKLPQHLLDSANKCGKTLN